MNALQSGCSWSHRIHRVHLLGAITVIAIGLLIVLMRYSPERVWTSLVPLLEATAYEQRYSDQDLRLWLSTQETVPVRHAELKELRERIVVRTHQLERWVGKEPTEQSLRNFAEALHQRASGFDLNVKLIRIDSLDKRAISDINTGNSKRTIQWHPITLRLDGDYQQTCRFLHQLAEEHPAQCRRIRWSILAGDSSRIELEVVLAIAIANENTLSEIQVEPSGVEAA